MSYKNYCKLSYATKLEKQQRALDILAGCQTTLNQLLTIHRNYYREKEIFNKHFST